MTEPPAIRVVSAELQRDGRYLIVQRPARAVLPLLWEFPGGRVREDESDGAALVRAVRDRVGVEVEVGECLLEVVHHYPSYSVTLAVYRCALASGEPRAARVAAVAWVAPEDFADYPFPGADEESVRLLVEEPPRGE